MQGAAGCGEAGQQRLTRTGNESISAVCRGRLCPAWLARRCRWLGWGGFKPSRAQQEQVVGTRAPARRGCDPSTSLVGHLSPGGNTCWKPAPADTSRRLRNAIHAYMRTLCAHLIPLQIFGLRLEHQTKLAGLEKKSRDYCSNCSNKSSEIII